MWKTYFYHTKSERLATVFLIFLLILLTALSWSFSFWSNQQVSDKGDFEQEVEAFEADIAWVEKQAAAARQAKKSKYKKNYYPKKQSQQQTEGEEIVQSFFNFNPNLASKEDFLRLGLSGRTAQSIINYREKGGEFRVKSDLAKIYTLDAEDYQQLEAYIDLPDSLSRRRPVRSADPASSLKKEQVLMLDINLATAKDFQKLRGIGPAFSKRIVKYRNALGGFVSIDQLGEVYGLPDSTFLRIRPFLQSNGQIQKINLNTSTAEELKSHPYLRWKHANAIVRYRNENGPFTDPEILRTFFEFDDGEGTYWKIKPYLSL